MTVRVGFGEVSDMDERGFDALCKEGLDGLCGGGLG